MKTEPVKQLDSYELTARPMAMEDIPALHALSIGVQWPHRPEDWAMLIRVGHGVVAEDAIGRVVGSAMWWPMGPDLARIGMVITYPPFAGAGRRALADAARSPGRSEPATQWSPPLARLCGSAYRLASGLGLPSFSIRGSWWRRRLLCPGRGR